VELPSRLDIIPTKCPKCGNDRIKREQLEMHGRWGFAGPAYRFDVYICGNCGYSEIFFNKATWL
jgi:predicted nucleic-acid-binding Zn-ribbon protein